MRIAPPRILSIFLFAVLAHVTPASAEDGYELWLRYRPLPQSNAAEVQAIAPTILVDAPSGPTLTAAVGELQRAFAVWQNRPLSLAIDKAALEHSGIILCLRRRPCDAELLDRSRSGEALPGNFRIFRSPDGPLIISASDEIGLLYGTFELLRQIQIGTSPRSMSINSEPKIAIRMLDHWDNVDGNVERGYAGRSIFQWWKLPGYVDPRIKDYARANASIGINAVAVNNVNAPATFLTARFIAKAAALADTLRPYGIRLFLSARFSAPRDLGDLETADPFDPQVQKWWAAKSDEIYAAISDFGGFLVKANSEGQPGPQDYGRTHADGANMLARAVGGRGVIIWRAFVYDPDPHVERTMQAYQTFRPLDGKFLPNVIVQVKNGPLDFQPREPVSPLFGVMRATQLGLEFQITKEYLGFSTHLVFLGPLFEEALGTPDIRNDDHSTLAEILAEKTGRSTSLIAGVANIGADRNWTGSHFDQANWYAFGRLAWNPDLAAKKIASEWVAQTFSPSAELIESLVPMMLASRQTAVDYMVPLGLAHQMGSNHHYGPAPWTDDLPRDDWNPVYYNKADANGIGFDRTSQGSNAVGEYSRPLARAYSDEANPQLNFLLWFHHKAWDDQLVTGRTTWDELVYRYDSGVARVGLMAAKWQQLRGKIDPPRFNEVASFLAIQRDEAEWWRDASISYFQSLSGRPLQAGHAEPKHSLDWYRAQKFPDAPGVISP